MALPVRAPRSAPVPRLSRADTARTFHALSEEIRIAVLELLRDGERCVCELTGDLGVAQSRLSWHLKTLKDAGLIRDRREGRWIYYALDEAALKEARTMVEALVPRARAGRHPRTSCC